MIKIMPGSDSSTGSRTATCETTMVEQWYVHTLIIAMRMGSRKHPIEMKGDHQTRLVWLWMILLFVPIQEGGEELFLD